MSHRQPRLVTGGVLRDYQLDGLDWLRVSIVCIIVTLEVTNAMLRSV